MKPLVFTAALALLSLSSAWADPPRVLDTSPTYDQRLFAMLMTFADEPDGIDGLGLSAAGAKSLRSYVRGLRSNLQKYQEEGHRFLCDHKDSLRFDSNALAAHFDTDGRRFVEIVAAAAKGLDTALDEADKLTVIAWMNENMDLAVVHLEGNPVREAKVSAEHVIARECGAKLWGCWCCCRSYA
ncbi:MAG: hypothetical protein AB7G76_09925 [Steroidobacteraceae bacterium]